jgi:hypothetical protein
MKANINFGLDIQKNPFFNFLLLRARDRAKVDSIMMLISLIREVQTKT